MPAVSTEKPMAKSSKPLMEKRRRARINDSLMQLKTLVLDALNKNNPRHSKLEKADILEMTVRYLRMVRRQQISASVKMDPSKLDQYRSGYAECVNEVTRYLGATSATDGSPELQTKLVGHLVNPSSQQQQQQQPKSTPLPQHQISSYRGHHQQQHQHSESSVVYVDAKSRIAPSFDSNMISPANHNGLIEFTEGTHQSDYYNTEQAHNLAPRHEIDPRRVVVNPSSDSAVQSLPSGDIAVVLPKQTLSNGQLPTHFIPVYAQGPVVLSPSTDVTSPALSCDSYRSHSPSSVPASPVGSPCTSPLTHTSSQVYQQLSPIAFEQYSTQYSTYEMATPISDRCVSKNETMWRPW